MSKIIFLHFAGGNSYSFRFLTPHLEKFETFVLELPGRGDRMSEDLLTDFESAALDLFTQADRCVEKGEEFIIYGHSLGAYMGLRICNLLENVGKVPKYLIVSGNVAPKDYVNKSRYLMSKADFTRILKELGGFPTEVLENEELMDFFEPIFRADFQLIEKQELKSLVPVSSPIFAMMGSEEKYVELLSGWQSYTSSNFSCTTFEGDHFFIHDHPEEIASLIRDCAAVSNTNS